MARFLETLELECAIERVRSTERLARIQELIERTHQLNTTGKKWGTDALSVLIAGKGEVYTLSARDRFVDYGLVGVCVIESGAIEILVVSCRVLGLGLEHAFLREVIGALRGRYEVIEALYIPTDRNHAARGIYAAHGFEAAGPDGWRLDLARYAAEAPRHVRSTARV